MSLFDSIFGKKEESPDLKFFHPDLGELVFEDEGWWKGQFQVEEQSIEIKIGGDTSGVNEELADYCYSIIIDFNAFYRKASKLFETELEITESEFVSRFSVYLLSSFWRHEGKSMFYMWFNDSNDENVIWRVQFDNDIATYLSCDT